MKSFVNRIVIALMVCALTGVVALAKAKTEMITFSEDTMVGSTLVRRGSYTVSLDEKTGELSIIDKHKKVLAKASTSSQQREQKASRLELSTTRQDNATVLRSLTFSGERNILTLGATSAAANNASN
jgi:hypothetical protein